MGKQGKVHGLGNIPSLLKRFTVLQTDFGFLPNSGSCIMSDGSAITLRCSSWTLRPYLTSESLSP